MIVPIGALLSTTEALRKLRPFEVVTPAGANHDTSFLPGLGNMKHDPEDPNKQDAVLGLKVVVRLVI